ncbi:MAG TPA: GspH/FimT family pseudopilin [Longimicrobium sp.]|jgi:prepilin-type N-terminal cleavage/methylation domain-containing protein
MSNNASVLRGRRGFTVAEMMIVVVIMGIATAIAAPRVQGMIRASSLTGAMNQVAADLQLARVRAIRAGRPVVLTVADGGTTYTVVEEGLATPVKRVRFTRDYPGVVLSPAPTSVAFDTRGMLGSSSERTITGTYRGARTSTLKVSGIGRVYREY